VTTAQVESYISKQAGYNYSKVFDQYLRTVQTPVLNYFIKDGKLSYKWTDCVTGFNLPIVMRSAGVKLKIIPSETWKQQAVSAAQIKLFAKSEVEKMYDVKILVTPANIEF
jgi:hypothetical protein